MSDTLTKLTSVWAATLINRTTAFGPGRDQKLRLPYHFTHRVLVWCAISSEDIFGSVFIDGSVTGWKYHQILQNEFIRFCDEQGFIDDFGSCKMEPVHIEQEKCLKLSTTYSAAELSDLIIRSTLKVE